MKELSIVTENHQSVDRDYLSRVIDVDYPKHKAAKIAKKWGFDYWDGDRRICYGGYHYRPGYWSRVAKLLVETYELTSESKILDVGCGKGFLLYEITMLLPGISVQGVDISSYAIENSKPEIKQNLMIASASMLPFEDLQFDLCLSINTLHNLYNFDLFKALKEIVRVSRNSFVCVESYLTELQKSNLIYWQVTCESFYTPDEWKWFFQLSGYDRDFEFIYFD